MFAVGQDKLEARMKHRWNLRSGLFAAIIASLGTSAAPAQTRPAAPAQTRPVVTESIKPVQVVRRSDGIWFVDFGSDAFAQLELKIAAPAATDAGRKITVRMGEKVADKDHLDSKPGGSIRFLETVMTTAAGKNLYRPELTKKDARWMPADIGPVMPFRYAELGNLPDGITADDLKTAGVRQIAAHYPFDDKAADFASSDEKLNAIWALCKHSIKATSYAGIFVDGDRERKPYEADAFINQLCWYYCTDDTSLPRHTEEYLITHPTWPTEWIMFSVMLGWQDYLFTGDATNLKTHYDDLKAKTLRALEREDGLISTKSQPVPAAVNESIHFDGTLKDIVDWPGAERDGYKMQPVNTVVNAFHCHSLRLMAKMAAALGKTAEAADFDAAAAKALASFNSKLFDPGTGLYIDGEGTKHSSLHANMFPLAFGLVPADRRPKVIAFIKSRGMACSVYGAQFLMDALFDNGEGGQAAKLMTAPGDRSWRHMVEEVGTTITLEAWDDKYKPNEDWNHAWGAAPANVLPAKVLGVEPLEPGYSKALIWPRCAGAADQGLAWARGKVPTVRGTIEVDWKRSATGFRVMVNLPPDVSAEMRLPPDWGKKAQVDGNATDSNPGDGYLVLEIRGGRHEVVLGKM
jgi:hypothetical protein